MAREKGTIKTGGRVKGTPNSTTATVRERITKIVMDNMDGLEEDIKALDPEKKLETLIKLFPYVAAKVIPVQEDKHEDSSTMTKTLLKLAELEKCNKWQEQGEA